MSIVQKVLCMAVGTLALAGAALATPGDVVISQAYGGGGNSGSVYKNDFIEIYNRSNAPVSIAGWSVQYTSSAGTTWQVTNIGTGAVTSLAPGQYYLVQEAVGAGGTTNLPTPDATGTIAMGGTGFKVALVNNTTALTGAVATGTGTGIVDFVGCSSGANGFETASAPAPSNANAVIRAGAGCTDTDNNSLDFTAAAAAPRNSASAFGNCFPTVMGACCDTLGVCTFVLPTSCSGTYQGDNVACNPCVASQGACCNASGSCFLSVPASCPGTSIFTALGTACAAANCGQYSAACCSDSDGSCFVTFPASCGTGNTASALGTTCSPNNCFQPSGACCTGNTAGSSCSIQPANLCASGQWLGVNATCTAGVCAPPLVVISQVYGGGGNTSAPYQQDYVELFNRSASAVDMSGWTLQYASNNGTSWARATAFPSGTTIAGGTYFLVLMANGGAIGTDLSGAADYAPASASNMGSTNGKIALLRTAVQVPAGTSCPVGGSAVVDFVGYGTSTDCSEGGAPTANLSSTTSAYRASNGCQDTDNNGADFAAAAPVPRNSLNTFSCNGPSVSVAYDPSAVCNGSSSTLTATVTAGSNPASTSYTITANLASIGGGTAVAFSGSFPTYTLSASPAPATPAGAHSIVVTVQDNLGRSATATISLYSASCTPAASTVVISQIYGGGGNVGALYTSDYVELFNRSGSPVDISTWSLQYASATDTGGTHGAFGSGASGNSPITFPSGTVIQPGRYYLIGLGAGAGGTQALPTPDLLATGLNINSVTGRWVLVRDRITSLVDGLGASDCTNVDIADLVGYGATAACFEGSGVAPDASNTTAALRRLAGCQDNNQNGVDVEIGAPTPRNSGSPANLCVPIVVTGVCCRGATCNTTVASGSCTGNTLAGAVFVSMASSCNGSSTIAPCCYPDYNKLAGITVGDIFDFLNDWFSGSPYANFAGDGNPAALAVQNIFDFLNAWFAGGC